jgi:starch synthase
MRILVAAAEALPYYKTGGLADVARALPDALVARGHDVRIIMPGYSFIPEAIAQPHESVDVPWPGGTQRAGIVVHEPAVGATCAFVRIPYLFDTRHPYDAVRGDPLSLGRRFAFFSRAVVAYAKHWNADVVHLNDWQTGLVPVYGLVDGLDAATLLTIHNLAYQGNFPPTLLGDIGIPATFMRTENGIEFHGHVSMLKAGIALSDRLNTVSPSYAAEIQTTEHGVGLEGLLTFRRRVLHGILNGIDIDAWNPATDTLLPATYTARTPARKDESRSALIDKGGLRGEGPVLGIVSRLAGQKGIDSVLGALPALMERGYELVVLGSGEPGLEHAIAAAAAAYPDRVATKPGFDEPLAHLIYAGADFFLMPSLYEPCGLGQMIAQRYGTPPVARRTGGLRDTITDGTTGFLYDEPSPRGLLDAIDRARSSWRARGWRALQTRCMREDHSWKRSAGEYERIYELAMGSLA